MVQEGELTHAAPSRCFADTPRDFQAAAHGNPDAQERLDALHGPAPAALSRREHEAQLDVKLVRKRTEAKQLSDRAGRGQKPRTGLQDMGGRNDLSRKKTMRLVEETAGGPRREAGRRSEAARAPSPAPPGQRQGYALQETYATPPGPGARRASLNPPPAPAQGRPSPSRPAASGASTPASAAAPASGTASNASGSSGTSAGAKGPPAKVYESFSEMGFAQKKAEVSGSTGCCTCARTQSDSSARRPGREGLRHLLSNIGEQYGLRLMRPAAAALGQHLDPVCHSTLPAPFSLAL